MEGVTPTTNKPEHIMEFRQATLAEIRKALSHGVGTRKVKISRTGDVTYYGSSEDTDRNHDYWHDGGTVEDWLVEDGITRQK